jgi:hypothetical protein
MSVPLCVVAVFYLQDYIPDGRGMHHCVLHAYTPMVKPHTLIASGLDPCADIALHVVDIVRILLGFVFGVKLSHNGTAIVYYNILGCHVNSLLVLNNQALPMRTPV